MVRYGFTLSMIACAALALAISPIESAAQDGSEDDFGDAPEGVVAYPSTGQIGSFPTCKMIGPAPWVEHGLGLARFYSLPSPPQQGRWDPDADGNAGDCAFTAYDRDECWFDGDAGLLSPTAYTIVGGSVVTCPNVVNAVAVGTSCGMATITARIENIMPGAATGFVNVLFDWNRDGQWQGAWPCAESVSAPEHAVVNDPIPNGFDGLWTSPQFRVGGNGGDYVWMRLEIANQTVSAGWDGRGDFEDGESEDYLVRIDIPSVPVQQTSWGSIKSRFR